MPAARGRKTPAELTAEVNPSHARRLVTTLAFPLLMLLAVPYWWYTTSIVRLPLPVDRIATLETSTVSPLPVKLLEGILTRDVAPAGPDQDPVYGRLRFVSKAAIRGDQD